MMASWGDGTSVVPGVAGWSSWHWYLKLASVLHPSSRFVTMDGYPVTINDACLRVESGKRGRMCDWLAEYHGGSAAQDVADLQSFASEP